MNVKTPFLPPRLITSDDPDLPAEFMAIEAEDALEAIDSARMAFFDPQVSLVVWANAADFVPESLKQSVHEISAVLSMRRAQTKTSLMPGFWQNLSLDDYFTDRKISQHFNKMAALASVDAHRLKEWRDNTLTMADHFEDIFETKTLKLSTRFQKTCDDYDGCHTDNGLRSDSLRVLRTVDGASALYYASSDVKEYFNVRGVSRVHLKEGAQPWTVRPWDVAFVSRNVAHQSPSPFCGFDEAPRRTLEVYDIRSSQEFVAGAQRPLLKHLLRRPMLDAY